MKMLLNAFLGRWLGQPLRSRFVCTRQFALCEGEVVPLAALYFRVPGDDGMRC